MSRMAAIIWSGKEEKKKNKSLYIVLRADSYNSGNCWIESFNAKSISCQPTGFAWTQTSTEKEAIVNAQT
jgi:hypothetical protein